MTTTRLNGFSAGKERLLVSVVADDQLSGNTLTYVNARAEILTADDGTWTDAPIRDLTFNDIASSDDCGRSATVVPAGENCLVPALQSAARYMAQFGVSE